MPRGRPPGSKNKPKAIEPKHEIQLIEKKKTRMKGRKLKVQASNEVQVFETADDGVVYRYETPEEINPFEATTDICECSFEEVTEWRHMPGPEDEAKKLGYYSSCRLPIQTTRKVFPLVAYIHVDLEKYRMMGLSDKQIYVGCINHLTRYQSKAKTKRMGDLYPYHFKVVNNKISAMFLTTERNSSRFWGKGE